MMTLNNADIQVLQSFIGDSLLVQKDLLEKNAALEQELQAARPDPAEVRQVIEKLVTAGVLEASEKEASEAAILQNPSAMLAAMDKLVDMQKEAAGKDAPEFGAVEAPAGNSVPAQESIAPSDALYNERIGRLRSMQGL